MRKHKSLERSWTHASSSPCVRLRWGVDSSESLLLAQAGWGDPSSLPAPQVRSPLLVAHGLHLQQRTVRLMIFAAALFIVSPFLLALKVTDLQSTLFRVITECELGSLWPHAARCQV